jgi:ABC-type Mn2+/Zn2+ transport system ATPase subunit
MLYLNQTILCDGKPADVLKNEIVVKAFGQISIPKTTRTDEPPPICDITGGEVGK